MRFLGEEEAVINLSIGCFLVNLVVFIQDAAQILFAGNKGIVGGKAYWVGDTDGHAVLFVFIRWFVSFFKSPPAAIAAGLRRGGAERDRRVFICPNGPSDHISGHEFGLQGFSVEEFF